MAELATADHLRGPPALNVVGVLCMTVPVAWWRSRPLPATVFLVVAALPVSALTSAAGFATMWFAILGFSFGLGAYAEDRAAMAGLGLIIAATIATMAIEGTVAAGDVAFSIIAATAFWLAGRTARNRSRLAGELHEAAARAKERRAAEAERAVADERRRIAREMHDVVAHSVSVMVVQAGGARRILQRDPARAEAASRLIAATGREAIVELQRLLGVLHVEPGPPPTLAGLDRLVDRARAAGQPVALAIEGERRALPADVELVAYRVVQEAITNAIKYAGGSPTNVRVGYGPDALQLEIRDRGGTAGVVGGGGHGLLGMRERVRVCGGELHAGRCSDDGFQVSARIPLGGEAASLSPVAPATSGLKPKPPDADDEHLSARHDARGGHLVT
jgi:signal transduction histidine kinase